mgnify:CR=1 FL=1
MPQAAVISSHTSKLPDILLQLNAEPASPSQVREWVADLFEKNHINLAVALAEAGLTLYPDSQDVLVISALLSEVQQEWPRAIEILEHLVKVQSGSTPAEVWHHLARTLRCDGQYPRARAVALKGLQLHPQSTDLLAMVDELTQNSPL